MQTRKFKTTLVKESYLRSPKNNRLVAAKAHACLFSSVIKVVPTNFSDGVPEDLLFKSINLSITT